MLILYAEDDPDDVYAFKEMMNEIDPHVNVEIASHGGFAISFLEKSSVVPSAIFLDVNMPEVNGLLCLKSIMSDERFKKIPVFIFSTGADPKDRERCMNLGATDYIRKPSNISEGVLKLSLALKKIYGRPFDE